MSFDTKCCVALISKQDTFMYWGFEWLIQYNEETKEIKLTSEYWDKGFPHSFLFQPTNETGSCVALRDCFRDFRKLELIEGDLPYKILSTLSMDFKYKLFVYALVKLPRIVLNKELRRLRNREDEIYENLEKAIILYEGSPLLFQEEQERNERFKEKLNKKTARITRAKVRK